MGDKITVSGGSCTIKTGYGKNEVNLNGGSSELRILANYKVYDPVSVTINAKSGTVTNKELYFNASFSDGDSWNYKKQGSNLVVSDSSGELNVTIIGFSKSVFQNGFCFKDGYRLSFDEIEDKTKPHV